MFPYWLLLIVLALGSIVDQPRLRAEPGDQPGLDYRIGRNPALVFVLIAITLMIGLRYKVGGDWNTYVVTFNRITSLPFDAALTQSPDEIGYDFLNWLAGWVGAKLWLVNLVCAIPFVIGLAALCRQQPNPWLALVVATPLFIIVLGMGFTRQASATGFMLIGLSGLARGRSYWWFLTWTLVGSLFHYSVLVLVPILPLFIFRATAFSALLAVSALIVGYYVLLPNALDRYSAGYIQQVYQAKGAIFRIAPNAFAGLMLLVFRRQYYGHPTELKVWRGMAILSLTIMVAFVLVRSSVILDRLSLYVLPLQIFVWARLPTAFGRNREPHPALTVLVIAYSVSVLALWLNLANHARFWLPYQIYPLS